MKSFLMARLFFCVLITFIATQVTAQHFISIQSDDKQPFVTQLNGTSFNSSKTGVLRISNLAAGNYTVAVTPAGKKYPPQNFTVAVNKADLSYTLTNLGKKGWALKNTKSAEVIASATTTKAPAQNQAVATVSPFAQMLAQVINDPELLNPTPWVLTTKVDGAAPNEMTNVMTEQQQNDTNTYVAETKGVIKAKEEEVKQGTEITFVDFNAQSGDTIHILIPSSDSTGAADSQAQVQPVINPPVAVVKTDTTAVQQQPEAVAKIEVPKTDSSSTVSLKKEDVKMDEPIPALDTSAHKEYSNPFFNKGKDTDRTTVKPAVENPVAEQLDNVQKAGNTAANLAAPQPIAADAVKPAANADCKRMVSESDQEKLKHRIYLETDQDKVLALTKKALNGKCINTAQVKELASFFLSDDARYNFFFTVYPYVYDRANFGTLSPYMIDRKYKDMFDAMLK